MIEVEKNKTVNTCIICPFSPNDGNILSAESCLAEAEGLALAINLHIVHKESLKLKEIKPALYFSKGFIEHISPIIAEADITLMVVDAKLSAIQQRNLERELKIKVIDRTALILEIFGERANTKEGVLQVELAHLTYQRSRLVRSWTHLERQRGGAGFLGGPGETQIELDRRVIDDKIIRLKKDLDKVKQTRGIQRGARNKVPYPIVALVGYTNAGKSTLFNYLTQSNVMVANMLFATLDPTMRKIKLPFGNEAILSDTVGFISDLPHELVMAFRATLEEVLNADIILHVRDISNPDTASQSNNVIEVLASLGLKNIKNSDNYIEVLNKSDLLTAEDFAYWQNKTANSQQTVLTSAYSGQGCDNLLKLIEQKLLSSQLCYDIEIPCRCGKQIAWLYQNSNVSSIETEAEINTLTVSISAKNIARFEKICEYENEINIRKKI